MAGDAVVDRRLLHDALLARGLRFWCILPENLDDASLYQRGLSYDKGPDDLAAMMGVSERTVRRMLAGRPVSQLVQRALLSALNESGYGPIGDGLFTTKEDAWDD